MPKPNPVFLDSLPLNTIFTGKIGSARANFTSGFATWKKVEKGAISEFGLSSIAGGQDVQVTNICVFGPEYFVWGN